MQENNRILYEIVITSIIFITAEGKICRKLFSLNNPPMVMIILFMIQILELAGDEKSI